MSNQASPNDPFYIRLLKFLVPYVLSVGGLAGGYTVAQKITSQFWLQVILAILAGLLVYALSFINKVWQKLEGLLVDKIASWVPSFLNNRFAGYRRQYLYYLTQAHRVLEFNGLTQRPAYNRELDHIFVEPNISPIPPHLASSHLLKRSHLAGSDPHDIWHYLSDEMLSSDAFVLLGAAGSGKTTLLKYIAFSLSQPHLRSQLRHKHHLHQSFPVLLYLRDYITTIKDKPESTLPELLQLHMQSKGHVTIPVQWFEQQFKRGKCLVMLDGLDETTDREERKLVVEWIHKQLLSYAKNRFILTSRPHGYIDTPMNDVSVLNIEPFTLSQIKDFVRNWYLIEERMRSSKNDTGVQLRADEGAGNLLSRLYQKSSLLEFAANPLLLTMITTLYSTGASLPENRLDLYREIFQVLLYRRRESIGLTPKLSVNQKLEVLQPLAFHMMQRHILELEYDRIIQVITPHLAQVSSELTPDDFLKDIKQNSGLFLEIDTDTWGFAHKTLQEYLAATHLKEKRRESVLLKHIDDDWWHETICFYCAQADATRLIQACLARVDVSAQALNLALECNDQKLRADMSIAQKIEELLQTGVDDTDSGRRSIIAEALLKRRLERMIYLRDDIYVDTSLVSCAEYQLFLDDQSAQGHYYHPWHWNTASFQPGQGHEPILGVQPLDVQAFCGWLTARDSGLWHYRLPDKNELALITSHLDKVAWSRHNNGFWTNDDEFTWIGEVVPEYKDLGKIVLDQLILDRARALDLDRMRARDRHEPIDDALELERKLSKMQVPDISPFLVHDIRTHPLVVDGSYFKKIFLATFGKTVFFSDVLSDAVKIAAPAIPGYLDVLEKRTFPPYSEEEKWLRWFARYQGQLQARQSYFQIEQTNTSQRQQQRLLRQLELEKSLARQEFEFYRKLCTDFALMELRAKGKLPPWEGILLVKERMLLEP